MRTCAYPTGLRRNMCSNTRWFSGFCNSHHVSHFTVLFIDARTKISIAESPTTLEEKTTNPQNKSL
ncbi:hypothetical protein KSP40_PGU009789 [Platanthera guangdongensis]|uniref:Uncharacterized protein n=1 Tax=Platanthera guangdongensis TaxID=2320717 RepID=A0ABR2LYD8_9ASPA